MQFQCVFLEQLFISCCICVPTLDLEPTPRKDNLWLQIQQKRNIFSKNTLKLNHTVLSAQESYIKIITII